MISDLEISIRKLANLQTTKKWVDKLNAQDVRGAIEVCTTEDLKLNFAGEYLSREGFIGMMEIFYAAFPDFSLTYESLEATGNGDTVVVTGIRVSGHHTGEPFQFEPYPPVPASGKYFELPPEMGCNYFRDGLIYEILGASKEKVSPAAVYEMLTGFPARTFFHASFQDGLNKEEKELLSDGSTQDSSFQDDASAETTPRSNKAEAHSSTTVALVRKVNDNSPFAQGAYVDDHQPVEPVEVAHSVIHDKHWSVRGPTDLAGENARKKRESFSSLVVRRTSNNRK